MDENRGVIGNRKKVRNEVRVEALVIKETDFNAVATSQNLDPEEAENLKFDQERSIPDTMALKRFYMRNIYVKIWTMRFGIIFVIKSLSTISVRLNLRNISCGYLTFESKAMMRKVQVKD